MDEQIPFFVYGTLKEGFKNAGIISSQLEARMQGMVRGFSMYRGPGFPYVIPDDDNGMVFGEIVRPYEHHYDRVMTLLDALEGVPHHYRRELVKVKMKFTKISLNCWMYVANTDEDSVVKLGDKIDDGEWNAQS